MKTKNTKPTPVSWKVTRMFVNNEPDRWAVGRGFDFPVVAQVPIDREDDAHLLAAAPDLLACCQWLEAYAPTPTDAAKVRAVIAKAEGQGETHGQPAEGD